MIRRGGVHRRHKTGSRPLLFTVIDLTDSDPSNTVEREREPHTLKKNLNALWTKRIEYAIRNETEQQLSVKEQLLLLVGTIANTKGSFERKCRT